MSRVCWRPYGEQADLALAALEDSADYGLIHADLISENMLWTGEHPYLIDFDDGGWGFRDFELATLSFAL